MAKKYQARQYRIEEFRWRKRDKTYVTLKELQSHCEKEEIAPFSRLVIVGENRTSIFEGREKYLTSIELKSELFKTIKKGDILCIFETEEQWVERWKDEAIEMERYDDGYAEAHEDGW